MKERFLNTGKLFLACTIHLGILAFIFKLWWPIAQWYLRQIPVWGIDLFNSVSYLTYLSKYFVLPVNGWKYIWFTGTPWGQDYSVLYFYLMLPLTKFFNIPQAVQVFALGANFALVAFSYLLFATLSKNRILAATLALGVAYSANIYRALVWAGGIPFFATQAMFPLILFLVVKFIQTQNKRFLVLAALVSGLGFLGHPQSFINFIFPAVFILLAFSSFDTRRFLSLRKIKNLALYGVITVFVGFPEFYRLFFSNFILRLAGIFNVNLLGITPPQTPAKEIAPEVMEWARSQFYVSFSDTNKILFYFSGILAIFFILGMIIRKTRIKALINTFAMGLVVTWVIFYIYLLSVGIDIYHGGWEAWYKLFWAVPVVMGALAAQFWGVFSTAISERLQKTWAKITLPLLLELGSGFILVTLGVLSFSTWTDGVVERIYRLGVFSSPFPEAVPVRISIPDQERIKNELKPSFLTDAPSDFRLYSNDQTVNIWWNSLFATPLARGYIDPPQSLKDRWGFFWLDAAFGMGKKGGTSLGDDWGTPEEVVEKNIPFLLDWYAIKYFEGNHGAHGSTGNLPALLTSEKFVEKTETREVKGGVMRNYEEPGKGEWSEERSQKVPFYKIKDDLVSPVHQATNVPAVLVVGGGDSFDIIVRFFGMMGLSSQKIIAARGSAFLDDLSLNELSDFDAVILYKYDYKNSKVWDKIGDYLKKGGKILIDTGAEVKESSSVDLPAGFSEVLPEIFPVEKTKRGDLGRAWEEEIGEIGILEGIKPGQFSDLIFDDKPWNISYPPGKITEVRRGAKILLSSHGYPVLVEKELGAGKIIWSGLNLPYHALRNYNFEEGKLLVNVFSRLLEFGQTTLPSWNLEWVSPQKRVISSQVAKGVLFKEQAFDGWKAKAVGAGGEKNLRIYKVGPVSPGFMYVRVPEKLRTSPFKVTFSFQGSFGSWVVTLLSWVTLLVVGDYLILRRRIFGGILGRIWSKFQVGTTSWWGKEDE